MFESLKAAFARRDAERTRKAEERAEAETRKDTEALEELRAEVDTTDTEELKAIEELAAEGQAFRAEVEADEAQERAKVTDAEVVDALARPPTDEEQAIEDELAAALQDEIEADEAEADEDPVMAVKHAELEAKAKAKARAEKAAKVQQAQAEGWKMYRDLNPGRNSSYLGRFGNLASSIDKQAEQFQARQRKRFEAVPDYVDPVRPHLDAEPEPERVSVAGFAYGYDGMVGEPAPEPEPRAPYGYEGMTSGSSFDRQVEDFQANVREHYRYLEPMDELREGETLAERAARCGRKMQGGRKQWTFADGSKMFPDGSTRKDASPFKGGRRSASSTTPPKGFNIGQHLDAQAEYYQRHTKAGTFVGILHTSSYATGR